MATDERLRGAERAARLGDESAEVRLVIEQVRSGKLTLKKLRERARKGDPTACAAHRVHQRAARTYTAYLADWDKADLGQPFWRLLGGTNARTQYARSVVPGDRLVGIRVQKKMLYLLGSMIVEELPDIDEYKKREGVAPLGETGCNSHVVVGESEHPYALREAPGSLVDSWHFETPKGEPRPIKYKEDGLVLRVMGMDAVYLLSDPTARAVAALLSSR
jgi:hypothetical protein